MPVVHPYLYTGLNTFLYLSCPKQIPISILPTYILIYIISIHGCWPVLRQWPGCRYSGGEKATPAPGYPALSKRIYSSSGPKRTDPAPGYVDPAPKYGDSAPKFADPAPKYSDPSPKYSDPSPKYSDPSPKYSDPSPKYVDPAPQYADPVPYMPYEQPLHNCTVVVSMSQF